MSKEQMKTKANNLWSTKYYLEKTRLSNTNTTNILTGKWKIVKGNPFLLQ
jgi:hypothetical protein